MVFECAHCELEFLTCQQSKVHPDVCVRCDIAFHEANLEILQGQMKGLFANA